MTDILSKLQPMAYETDSFSVSFPAVTLDFGYSRQIAEHKYVFQDEALIQNLGRKNRTWRLLIPFRENLDFGGYKSLYTKAFPLFFAACQSSLPGLLTTPDAGQVRVTMGDFKYSIDPQKRDGVDVTVEFISSPEQEDQGIVIQVPSDEDLAQQGASLDSSVAASSLPTADKPPSFSDPFQAVSSVLDQLSRSRDKNFAKIDHAIESVNRMQDSVDRLGNARNWSLQRQANDFKATLTRAKQQTDSAGNTLRAVTINAPITINVLASKLSITLKDLLTLNPALAAFPLVPANTTVRYPAKAGNTVPPPV